MLFKKKTHSLYFPVTSHGVVYLLGAAGLVTIGLYRGEMGSALAGLLLLSYALVSLFGCLVAIPFWRKAQLRLEQSLPGRFSLAVSGLPPRIIRYFCGARLSIHFLRAQDPRADTAWRLDLPISEETTPFIPASPGRGVYLPRVTFLALHDFASFFAFRLYAPARNSVERVIYPAIPEAHAARGLVSGGSERHTGKSTFERSENLYETRTYLPGDDPRKINWKVYAHSGSLSVREGELLPPPAAELYCILSTNSPKRPGSALRPAFSALANRTAAYLEEHLEKNKTLILILTGVSGEPEYLRIEPGNPDRHKILTEALALPVVSFSGADVLTEAVKLPLQATVMVFSLPGARIPASFSQNFHWFTGPYPLQAAPRSFTAILDRWLFVSNSIKNNQSVFLPSEFDQYVSRLEEEGIHAHIL